MQRAIGDAEPALPLPAAPHTGGKRRSRSPSIRREMPDRQLVGVAQGGCGAHSAMILSILQ
ncbi:hypothetical protein [Kamptonema formosum]|uniref:hypothetical protein n=1 Tax=Kamptonema formosum TaxID=331992 RepID=UPI00034692CF|nr:hypothetical protein [Oscillatoria sp. PCC 10802]